MRKEISLGYLLNYLLGYSRIFGGLPEKIFRKIIEWIFGALLGGIGGEIPVRSLKGIHQGIIG